MNRDYEKEIFQELWDGTSEILECIPRKYWGQSVVPVLVRMVSKERQLKEYYKKRLDNAERIHTGQPGMVGYEKEQDWS